jgi:molybdenum cofactor cytidylyltransferase
VTVAIAILAAGRGSRLGGELAKPLLPFRGTSLLAHAVDAATSSGLAPVLVVIGHRADEVAAAVPSGVEIVRAREWERGVSGSLRAALDALEPVDGVGAVCLGLADQPLVGPDSYRRLAAAYDEGAELAVATYDGARGNPVLLARTHWPEARALDGDVGARALMRNHPVVEVDCTSTGSPVDVDTLTDLHTLEPEDRHA